LIVYLNSSPFDSIRSQQPIQFPPSIRLTEKDILKIAAFYKSMGTLVHVAHSLATLYTSDFDAMANLKDWKKLYTGVPIWLFNTGMNPKRLIEFFFQKKQKGIRIFFFL
jgi:hypothetical protein